VAGSGVSRPLRIALFGDGAWAAASAERLQDGPHRVVCLVGRRRPTDGSLAAAAATMGVPLWCPDRVDAPETLEILRTYAPDLALSIAYDQIFRRPLLESLPLGCVNFHAGKLPFYRGRNVINWAIINGERELGVTAHLVDEGIDSGDIVLQRTLPIAWTDTYGDVLCRVVQVMPDLVEETVRLLARGECPRTPQVGPGTYFGGRRDGDEWLDWTESSSRLHNKVRAISRPGPGARTLLDRAVVTIWRAHFDPSWPMYLATPGQVVGRSSAGVVVKTGDSTLLVQEVQLGSGTPQVPDWPIGTRLGVNAATALQALLARLPAFDHSDGGQS
jgi:methionyl-tRNA formyltransferase